ncbi:MAG: hypothetical protein PHN75_09000 [Syntrophales bacterium]|nr:hypothetical protein [Syntrophales bacterium]
MIGPIAKSRWMILSVILVMIGGCFLPQVSDTTQKLIISLQPNDLQKNGVAFITPSTATGQEEEKQAIALIFTDVMKKDRPQIRCLTLAETLNAINKAGLADEYKRMFADYRDTGIFSRDVLRKVGAATGTKFVAQIKLMSFSQGSDGRLSAFGVRLVETKNAHLRLFFQIWDTESGTIVWEAVQEMHYAVDAITEKAVTQKIIVDKAAKDFVSQLP